MYFSNCIEMFQWKNLDQPQKIGIQAYFAKQKIYFASILN